LMENEKKIVRKIVPMAERKNFLRGDTVSQYVNDMWR
jgi:hypothetical protein